MTRPRLLWHVLGPIAAKVRRARAMIVAIDFDGTLTPIVSHPDQARLSTRARRVLAMLARQEGVEVAVISGRCLDDLRRRVRIPGIHYAGTAGLETLVPGGRREVHVPDSKRLPREIWSEAYEWCSRHAGAWVEDKDLTLALHYRDVDPSEHHAFIEGVRRRWRSRNGRIDLVHGKMVFELMPAVRWNKASALRRIWKEQHALVFYLGDDMHDEPVHEFVRRYGGVSVAIGRTVSHAQYLLKTPEEVVWWLEWLQREWHWRQAAAESVPSRSSARARRDAPARARSVT